MRFPKTTRLENPHLLSMARGRDCLMRVPGVCNNDTSTTVAAHSNRAEHGKALGRKADDHFSAWACFRCHSWLDQGPGARDRELGQGLFTQALARQILAWGDIERDPTAPAKDRQAALWALFQYSRHPEGATA